MFGQRLSAGFAIVFVFLAWTAYLRSSDVGETSQAEKQLPAIEEPPPVAETPSEPFVFVDPATALAFGIAPGVKKKDLITEGRVPYLTELVELELELGGEEASHTYSRDSAVYFGLQGDCELHLPGGESYSLEKGSAVTVFPDVLHNAAHSGGPERCKVLRVVTQSGRFTSASPVQAGSLESLPSVRTAHESNLLSKKVYLGPKSVPGLFQVSLSRFAPGAECEQHRHRSAAEVYVNFDGSGCHLEMHDWQNPSKASVYNISGGKVAVVNPTTLHRAWNSAKGPCQSVNMMIGAPWE